jgi:multiple sugar transport system ATP-binding protein
VKQETTMATLELEHVVKHYPGGVRAVDDFTLEVADGERMVLVGPSGCGKTTTLRLIAGLETVTQGTISLDDRVMGDTPPNSRDVAMVFQNYALYPHMTVADNMAFGPKLRRIGKAEIERRVREAADVLGISRLLGRRPGELSGGEHQRVALGRAIVRKPRLFLFDEPLSNLDADLRTQMRHEIRRLHTRLGTTMVYVTHDQTEAMTLGQRIAVIREGRVQQVADPQTLYDRPANRFVAGLIGSPAMNFFDGRIEPRGETLVFRAATSGPDAEKRGFTLPLPVSCSSRLESHLNRPIVLGIRPEHVGSPDAQRVPRAARIPAVVEAVEPVGPESYVYYRAATATFVSRVQPGRQFTVGAQARPALATDKLHFFDPKTEDTLM